MEEAATEPSGIFCVSDLWVHNEGTTYLHLVPERLYLTLDKIPLWCTIALLSCTERRKEIVVIHHFARVVILPVVLMAAIGLLTLLSAHDSAEGHTGGFIKTFRGVDINGHAVLEKVSGSTYREGAHHQTCNEESTSKSITHWVETYRYRWSGSAWVLLTVWDSSVGSNTLGGGQCQTHEYHSGANMVHTFTVSCGRWYYVSSWVTHSVNGNGDAYNVTSPAVFTIC
jgi:hypothetical protein